jgi:hypothetical protein
MGYAAPGGGFRKAARDVSRPEGTDKLGEAVNTLYEIVRKPKAK